MPRKASSSTRPLHGSSRGEDLVEVRSNLVRTPVEGGEAALTYAAPDGRPISTAALNSNVRLHLSAAACNTTPGADSVRIRIATDPEADLETAVATETGPNTGLFTTALIPIQRVLPVVQGDSVVSGDRNTKVSASATCGGQTVSAILTVNPGGFVFHSASNVAIPGATVILYDASGAEIERIVSDADGFYVVSAAQNAGAYRIEVLPPEGFSFPSDRKVFPALGRNVDAEASYGAAFTTTGAFSGIDIPLDPDASSVLRLEKSVDEANPAPGDILVYSLTLTNTTGIGLVSAAIRDGLPKGISYLEGTARLDGKPVEVSGFPGRNLTFDLGFVGPDDTVALTYMAAVDPTAQGRLANVALASGNLAGRGEVLSNEARALVRIQRDGGVFSDEGVVLGKVYADLNGNGQQDRYLAAGRNAADGALERVEPGVPGVKLQFSNGASVVTDIDGKYSLPGLPPGSHVIAVSTPTLPATVKLRSTTARDALSPQSRYLRLLPGQVVSEYFAVSPREGVSREEVLAELEFSPAGLCRKHRRQQDCKRSRAAESGRRGMGGLLRASVVFPPRSGQDHRNADRRAGTVGGRVGRIREGRRAAGTRARPHARSGSGDPRALAGTRLSGPRGRQPGQQRHRLGPHQGTGGREAGAQSQRRTCLRWAGRPAGRLRFRGRSGGRICRDPPRRRPQQARGHFFRPVRQCPRAQ